LSFLFFYNSEMFKPSKPSNVKVSSLYLWILGTCNVLRHLVWNFDSFWIFVIYVFVKFCSYTPTEANFLWLQNIDLEKIFMVEGRFNVSECALQRKHEENLWIPERNALSVFVKFSTVSLSRVMMMYRTEVAKIRLRDSPFVTVHLVTRHNLNAELIFVKFCSGEFLATNMLTDCSLGENRQALLPSSH
jgi:hypothetical protein